MPMNLSAPFVHRPVATTLLSLGLVLAGMVGFSLLPVAPLPLTYDSINISSCGDGLSYTSRIPMHGVPLSWPPGIRHVYPYHPTQGSPRQRAIGAKIQRAKKTCNLLVIQALQRYPQNLWITLWMTWEQSPQNRTTSASRHLWGARPSPMA